MVFGTPGLPGCAQARIRADAHTARAEREHPFIAPSTWPARSSASTWRRNAGHADHLGGELLYPTEPSICSSIRRLHSTAYSMGRVRVMGSMKPLTIMPMACSSERPRLMR